MNAPVESTELERRIALAVIEGDQLGTPPILGLFRRALEEYQRVIREAYAAGFYFRSCEAEWTDVLPGYAYLGVPWMMQSAKSVLCVPGRQIAVQEGAAYLADLVNVRGARSEDAADRSMVVLQRIEHATQMLVTCLYRICGLCKYDAPWESFVWIGNQKQEPGEPFLELRNCPQCSTTLARVL
jgi:hypothetical protein